MRTRRHGSTPPVSPSPAHRTDPSDPTDPSDSLSTRPPAHAFTPEYLALLSRRDEPVTASEADAAGPWHLEPHSQGWAVLRRGESLDKGSRPTAVFAKQDAARLAAAILPGTGRRLRYKLGAEPDSLLGYPVLDEDQIVGHMLYFDESFLAALNVVDALVSLPGDLAWVIDAAGGLTLDHAGKIALERALA